VKFLLVDSFGGVGGTGGGASGGGDSGGGDSDGGVAIEPRIFAELFAHRLFVGAGIIKGCADDCSTGLVGQTIQGVDSSGGQRRQESNTGEDQHDD
jgi:hypothetical protein